MRKFLAFLAAGLLITSTAWAKEYAIIKDTMFGSQKIEIFQSLKDALENYTGEGKIYEITLKPVSVKRIETKKKVEVSEYKWSVDDKAEKVEKPEKTEKPEKAEKAEKPASPKN